ncbi:hypothetical protein ACF3NG_06985 [Aerococcaceae bacterium WGS1372]
MKKAKEPSFEEIKRVAKLFEKAIVQLVINILVYLVFDNFIVLSINTVLFAWTIGAFILAFNELNYLKKID